MIANQVTTTEEARQLLAKQGMGEDQFAFLRALVEAGQLTTTPGILGFLEKPWHWGDEFLAWEQAGRPLDHSAPGWDEFCEAALR